MAVAVQASSFSYLLLTTGICADRKTIFNLKIKDSGEFDKVHRLHCFKLKLN